MSAELNGNLTPEEQLTGALDTSAQLVGSLNTGSGGGGTDDYNDLSNKPQINGVTLSGNKTTADLGLFSGNYNDLTNKPTIPAAQVNSDWNSESGVSEILNKPTLATVATSGSYDDLTNKPTIPAAQVNSDWDAVSGVAQILNKPTIPAAQVNSDWNAVSGVEEILNKPTIPTSLNDMSDVTITNPASSEALVYDGTKWVNDAIPSGVTTLAALSDVTLGTLYADQTLKWTGYNWTNSYFYYNYLANTPHQYTEGETVIGIFQSLYPVYQYMHLFDSPVSCAAGNSSAAGTWTSLIPWNDSITVLDFKAWSNSGNAKTYWGHLSAQWSNTALDIRALNIRSTAAPVDGFTMIYYYNT